jgi:hypothetical protein
MIFHVTMITYDGCCIFLISFCGPTILLGNPVDSYMNYVSSFFYLCTAISLSLKLYTLFTGLVISSSLLVSQLLPIVVSFASQPAILHFNISE